MERPVDINSKDYAFDVLAKLNSFRNDSKYCDFIIKAGKKGVPVHRCVVAASSEYFDAMLSHDTKESREGMVVIKQADPESIEKCVDFMYTGKADVSEEKQGDLLHVAHMLQLHRLYNGIALFLERALNCESFFSTREVANLYSCDRLMEVCDAFALKNFRAIAKMEGFRGVEATYIDFLLSSDGLKESDRTKCKALMVWINYDSSRAASLFNMMKHIEFMNIPLSYRRFLMDKEPAISESNECLKLLMKSILDGEKVKASDASLDPGIVVLDHTSKKMQCLDIENAIWTEMQNITENMASQQCTVVVLDEYLYVLVADRTNYRIKYQECQAKWEQIAQRSGSWGLPAVLQGYIYVTEHSTNSMRIERYCNTQNQWSFITNRAITVYGSAIAVVQDSLFLFGGRNSNNNAVIGNVQKFEPATSIWSDVASLGQARYNASAVTFNDAIYVFGGYNASNQPASNFEIFHSHSNTAELVTLPNLSRINFCCHVLDGMIYLVGGNTSAPQTIDVYDPKTKALKTVATLENINIPSCASVVALT